MMKGEILVMSEAERRRCHLLQMALDGRITVKDAGELMRVSYRPAHASDPAITQNREYMRTQRISRKEMQAGMRRD